jgi:hypothetical protein
VIVSVLILVGILWLFVLGMERGTRSPSVAGVLGLFVSCFMYVGVRSPVLLMAGFLMMLTGFICRWRSIRPARFAFVTLATIPAAMAWNVYISHERIEQFRQWQQEYKFESLAERLKYETRANQSIAPETAAPEVLAVSLSGESIGLMEEVDQQVEAENFIRPWLLSQLHHAQLNAFASSPGFGVTRGVRFNNEQQIRTEPRPTIVPRIAPEVPYRPDETISPTRELVRVDYRESDMPDEMGEAEPSNYDEAISFVPSSSMLKQLHRESAIDFVNPQGFGLIESPRRVAGFDAHAFSKLPKLEVPQVGETAGTYNETVASHDWMLASLQLVSMLKHETPVVYVTNELPRMEQLRSEDIPTRSLDAFEAMALPKIKQGEMIVVEENTNRIRMLGAVRAGNKCIECHEVPRNTLLGAFSYELARTKPLPETKPVAARPEL